MSTWKKNYSIGKFKAQYCNDEINDTFYQWYEAGPARFDFYRGEDEKADAKANATLYAGADGLVDALIPFAELADELDRLGHSDDSTCEWRIKASDIRAALAALKAAGVEREDK